MYTLQSFIGLDREINNDPNVVAPLGELSTMSRTFARDIQVHRRDESASVAVHVFSSRQDDTPVELRNPALLATFDIVDYLYQRAINGQTTDSKEALQTTLETDLGGTYSGWVVGEMVTNGVIWLPEFVIANVLGQEEDTVVRIFFADAAFQNRYDQYHIQVIHPVDNIDQLQGSIGSIVALTEDLDMPKVLERVDEQTNPYPYTLTRSFNFEIANPNDPNDVVTLPWVVAIYGRAGDNLDAIYTAIRQSILDNSTYPVDQWEDRIPDLFKTVEFTIVPFWDQYSVPNQTVQAGLYSPLVRVNRIYEVLASHMPVYGNTHIQSFADLTFYLYKSVAFGICGGPENRNDLYDIRSFFPDYSALSTTSIDFNRLSPETRGFVHRLAEQLKLAESVGEFTLLPGGFSKTWRENKLYVVSTYQNIQFYVLAKLTYGVSPEEAPQ